RRRTSLPSGRATGACRQRRLHSAKDVLSSRFLHCELHILARLVLSTRCRNQVFLDNLPLLPAPEVRGGAFGASIATSSASAAMPRATTASRASATSAAVHSPLARYH